MRLATTALAACLLAMPMPAAAFEAENGVRVDAGDGLITPRDGGGYGARGRWCAAADYARDVLGAGGNERLYIAQPRSNMHGPVRFALGDGSEGPRVFIVGASLRQQGANLTVGHAYGFCADAKVIDW